MLSVPENVKHIRKFAAAPVAMPSSVLRSITTLLFPADAVSGIHNISTVPSTRGNIFAMAASLAFGYARTLAPISLTSFPSTPAAFVHGIDL